jgi:hypothetical protein
MDPHPVHDLEPWGSLPTGDEELHVVPPRGETSEDLVQVHLSAPGLGVPAILPVDDEEA